MIKVGKVNVQVEDILSKVTLFDIVNHYFGVTSIPCIIRSPLRQDNHPSFGFHSPDGENIRWVDYGTNDRGDVFDLLSRYWGESYRDVLIHLWEDLPKFTKSNSQSITKSINKGIPIRTYSDIELQSKSREWRDYDLEFWSSFGISLKWLKYANVYPISYKIIIKNGKRYTFAADKYAYAYLEFKEGKVTQKIYQPFNKKGFKWSTSTDRSVISLWTKVPEFGQRLCICSSLKDSLCMWANTGIPCINPQGEGYTLSETAVKELKRRYDKVYILYDNDEAGEKDSTLLAESTGFIKLTLPKIEELGNPKDISDLYKAMKDKQKFKETILKLFET